MVWTEVLLAFLVVSAQADETTESHYEDYEDYYIDPPLPDISEAENETYFAIGDMLISKEHYPLFFEAGKQRKGLVLKQMMWPVERGYPTMPYSIGIDDEKASENIGKAIKHWEDKTCIRFRLATDKDKAYVRFINGKGCSSAVGRVSPYSPQTLKLARGCREVGVIVHELGHAIGFTHEMMRSDRNDYLTVVEENIVKGHTKNFMLISNPLYSSYGVPLDYTSIMMYNTRSFTNNGGITLKTKDPMVQGLPGSFQVLSHRDALLANLMYDCIDVWVKACGLEETYCKNDGYVSRDCICICPPGTKGYQCEQVVGGYYDELMPKCNQVITEGGTTIQSPKYPRFEDDGTSCVYHIIAPEEHTIEIIFEFFDIFEYRQVRCKLAAMIFMEDKINKTTITCGRDFRPGKSYKSSTNDVRVFFDIRKKMYASRGYKAIVNFISHRKLYMKPRMGRSETTTSLPSTTAMTTTPATTTRKISTKKPKTTMTELSTTESGVFRYTTSSSTANSLSSQFFQMPSSLFFLFLLSHLFNFHSQCFHFQCTCGNDFLPGDSYKSSTNDVLILFDILQMVVSRGFKGRVEFKPKEGASGVQARSRTTKSTIQLKTPLMELTTTTTTMRTGTSSSSATSPSMFLKLPFSYFLYLIFLLYLNDFSHW